MSGGGGYVLSKEALNRFVTIGMEDKESKICKTSNFFLNESFYLSKSSFELKKGDASIQVYRQRN